MNTEHTFLIRYGLHNFVSCGPTPGSKHRKAVFAIKRREGPVMVDHAKFLIRENFGETADVRVI